ncbi:MAG TPA: fimbrial protein [Dyella sp.]|uniref:fimbrial protein n=1 Tax=Dyella sp. TaxID=1869338 RepID=UPI002F93B904
MRHVVLRGVLGLAIYLCIAIRPASAECIPSALTVGDAVIKALNNHSLDIRKVSPGSWHQVQTYEFRSIPVMSGDCSGIAKSFVYAGQASGGTRWGGFGDDGAPRFTVNGDKSNGTVAVSIYVSRAGENNYTQVKASTASVTLSFAQNVASPAIDVKLIEYVKIPLQPAPGKFIDSTTSSYNIFPSSSVNIDGLTKTEVPFKARTGTSTLYGATCSVSSSERNKQVAMGDIDSSVFSGAGSKSKMVPFTFSLEDCSLVTSSVHMTFESDGPALTNMDLFPTDNPGLGLGLVALDARGTSTGGKQIERDSQVNFDAQAGEVIYRFEAFLEQLNGAAVSPGGVTSKVRVLVNYD